MEIEKSRLELRIDKRIIDRFRNKFVRKKGDISNKIQEMMEEEMKRK